MKNGKGKSTIAKAVIGQLEPLSGKIERHQALKVGYFDQVSSPRLLISRADSFSIL